jgi:predicted NBD/HSP70 family sugar kinase
VGAASPGHLLELIRTRPGWTRQQLLAETGMSRTTLFDRLEMLFAHGLVYEAGSAGSGGGRPAVLLRFDDRTRVILVFDLGQTHARISVTDLAGRTIRMAALRLDISDPPGVLLPWLLAEADRLVDAGSDEQLAGVGMGIPGPVDARTGRLGTTTTMPGWEQFPIEQTLRARWDVPLLIENDARAFALGEASVGSPDQDATILAVKFASGIGAGIVVGGRVVGGADGAAGDIGHIRLTDDGPVCRCGRRGCLAAWASGRALVERLRPTGVRTVDDVVSRVQAADPEVMPAVREASGMLGRVLASVVATINPHVLALGGGIGRLPDVVSEIDHRIHADAVDRTTRHLTVRAALLADESPTVGLATAVTSQVFSPSAIDALVEQPRLPGASDR